MSRGKREAKPERAKCLNGETPQVPCDAAGEEKYPLLFDLLVPRYKEGVMTRAEAAVSFRSLGGCFRVTINAPTEAVQAVFLVNSLVTMFADIERILASGEAQWLPDYESQKRARQALRK